MILTTAMWQAGANLLDITQSGQEPNAIQLVRICLIGQCLTQNVSWLLHQGVLFGTPLADTRFVPRGTVGIHDEQ